METPEKKHADDIPAFEAAIKKGTTDPFPYERLMIYYRKAKNYAKELIVITKAIKTFEAKFERLRTKTFARSKKRLTIERLSATISKSTGLTDKKGNELITPEPIAKWMRRKKIVEKKIAAS